MNFHYGNIEDLLKWRLINEKNGYTVVELAIVLGIFSICYFTATWVISSKLNVNYEEEMYNQKIACIENNAVLYAKA